MCGRYASFRETQDLADAFDVEEITERAGRLDANYNVAPTDGVRIVLDRAPKATDGADNSNNAAERTEVRREMHVARWGLVPGWAQDLTIGSRMFNARSDSLAAKPAFSKSLRARRCVVVADGYYEWLKEDIPGQAKPRRTPFYIHRSDGAPLAFAGLYAWWRDPNKESDDPDRWVLSTTIVTEDARGGLAEIHDREPVVLPDEQTGLWLDPAVTGPDEALAALTAPSPPLRWHEVSARVGSVQNNDESLIAPT
ncbi:SOS response-associated peptidase [Ruania halotolerans]|uniref:SOS response-associated peptidase n=1 Tax=Ruania halotolerans TaxID=2897773 RepID=UPI001E5690EF|nr:SOS response-associated peptidase [Ruania halotolerans]UFU05509.1 SOS response-associated peptidase [Ruania halotolerans]